MRPEAAGVNGVRETPSCPSLEIRTQRKRWRVHFSAWAEGVGRSGVTPGGRRPSEPCPVEDNPSCPTSTLHPSPTLPALRCFWPARWPCVHLEPTPPHPCIWLLLPFQEQMRRCLLKKPPLTTKTLTPLAIRAPPVFPPPRDSSHLTDLQSTTCPHPTPSLVPFARNVLPPTNSYSV